LMIVSFLDVDRHTPILFNSSCNYE
jgi:hypothetical protein